MTNSQADVLDSIVTLNGADLRELVDDTGRVYETVRVAVNGLSEFGYVEAVGLRASPGGRSSTLWAATDAGVQALGEAS